MSDVKTRVNTYLYSAQTLAKQAEEEGNAGFRKTLVVGASLSLKQSWGAWLDELASYLKIPSNEIEDQSLERTLNLPDCQLLFSLKKEQGSWLQQLNVLCSNPLYYYEKELSQAQGKTAALEETRIDIVDLSRTSNEVAKSKSLPEVIREFKAYIQNTREQQTEW